MKMRKSTSFQYLMQTLRAKAVLAVGEVSCIALAVILSGALLPEIYRRVTGAILMGDAHAVGVGTCVFLGTLLASLLIKIAQQAMLFSIKRRSAFALEDSALRQYENLPYWNVYVTAADALGKIRQTSVEVSSVAVERYAAMLQKILLILSASLYACTINIPIWLMTVATVGIVLLLTQRGAHQLPQLSAALDDHYNGLHGLLWEQVKNHEIAGLLSPLRVPGAYQKRSDQYLSDQMRWKRIGNRVMVIENVGPLLMMVVVCAIGGFLHLNGTMHLEDVYAMVIVIPTIANAMLGLPQMVADIKNLQGHYDQMDQIFALPKQAQGGVQGGALGPLVINDVHFTYPGNQEETLKGISMAVPNSGLVCLAGHSGCGKSTLLKLIARLLPLERGDVRAGETNVDILDRAQYFQKIAYLDQKPHIWRGTLAHNILLEQPFDARRLDEAIRDAGLSSLLEKLPRGLETCLDASELSNGELQKICFARLFYQNKEWMLLDEATAALDPGAERQVIQALTARLVKEERIVLCVSHRAYVLEAAERVIWIDKGQIVAQGSHVDLLRTLPAYGEMLAMGGDA